MTTPIPLNAIGRLPTVTDNCAVALQILPAGTQIAFKHATFSLSHTILEGHRFAVKPIAKNEPLLSWGATFGIAEHPIAPGDYVCNSKVLVELNGRGLDFPLPEKPNFSDELDRYHFDQRAFQPAARLPRLETEQTFRGFKRPGGRGVGTRNTIVILGVSSHVSGFVNQLVRLLKPLAHTAENIDDIVAVAHTEGSYVGGNNQDLLLRTLTGFMVHPNVGAVLCVDLKGHGVTNDMIRHYAVEHNRPLAQVIHGYLSLEQSFGESLAAGVRLVTGWLESVNQMTRTAQPLSELKIALQCGGSDAFSGISGNPLAAWVAKQIIQFGGAAVLAETDELKGAEAYVLDKVCHPATAERFLQLVDRFDKQVSAHGQSGEGNPSGGNLYRGLYNIYLKSLGAATKRDPDVPLEFAINYADPMTSPGYYFMDSPGNDLESIAGQVATGCNMIFFVTGNGSITNFPFVPTIKIVTTTQRFQLLQRDMDINAGAYLDGTALSEVGQDTLAYTLAIASGQRSVGEQAGHSQVQIWRDWHVTDTADSKNDDTLSQPSGSPISVAPPESPFEITFEGWGQNHALSTDRVGLILPTSLCSGQIAQIAVSQLNELAPHHDHWPQRFVTLVHTEGCGASIQPEYEQTMLGYLQHPMVAQCLLLEHGCESTHNSFWRQKMIAAGHEPASFGWGSVQLDGGIEQSIAKLTDWFTTTHEQYPATRQPMGAPALKLAILSSGPLAEHTANKLAEFVRGITTAGGTVVLIENDQLLAEPAFSDALFAGSSWNPTLAFGQPWATAGLHIMQTPARQWTENVTGVVATGVELVVALSNTAPLPGHPLAPVLLITDDEIIAGRYGNDYDLYWPPAADLNPLLQLVAQTASGTYTPQMTVQDNVAFQITRGRHGVSL